MSAPATYIDLVHEVAWGYGPYQASPVWTDITGSDTVRGGEVRSTGDFVSGRSSAFGEFEATSTDINCANDDGRYTRGYNKGMYAGLLKDGCPYRHRIRYPKTSGSWYTVWGGTITDIRPGYEDLHSVASISVQQRLSGGGLGKMGRLVADAILADKPSLYWPLTDVAGSSEAAEVSGNQGPTLTVWQTGTGGAVDFGFGTAPGPDAGSAAVFTRTDATNYGHLTAGPPFSNLTANASRTYAPVTKLPSAPQGGHYGGFTVEAFFEVSGLSIAQTVVSIVGVVDAAPVTLKIVVNTSGDIEVTNASGVHTYGAAIAPFTKYHVAVTEDPISFGIMAPSVDRTVWLDGVPIGSEHDTSTSSEFVPTGTIAVAQALDGSVSDVAIFNAAINPVSHASAGLDCTETADARFTRLCRNAGIAADWYATSTTDPSIYDAPIAYDTDATYDASIYDDGVSNAFTAPIAPQETAGRALVDVLKELELADQGRISDDGGVLTITSLRALAATAPALELDPLNHFNLDGRFGLSAQDLVNEAKGQRPDGNEVTATNSYSQYLRGRFTGNKDDTAAATFTPPLTTDQYVQYLMEWIVNTRGVPRDQIPSVTLDAEKLHRSGLLTSVLALAEGDLVQFGSEGSPLPEFSSPGKFVYGVVGRITHSIGKDQWLMKMDVYGWVPLFTVGDPLLGRLAPDENSMTVSATITDAAASMVLVTAAGSPPLTTTDLPVDLDINGERVRVTAVSGPASPQTLAITRGVAPSYPAAHSAGEVVGLWSPGVIAYG